MNALLIVDLQNDFMPGGPLGVNEGDNIIPIINDLCKMPFDVIVATKDWHPSKHISFAENHGKKPGKHITIDGIDQILWPRHCVQETIGAELVSSLNKNNIHYIVHKGTDPKIDSYSTFFDNLHLKKTGLHDFLKQRGINKIYIVGLATDYCVKYSVLDALRLGYKPYIIVDACRGVNIKPDDSENALKMMKTAGAILTTYSEVKSELSKGNGKTKQLTNRPK